MKMICAANVMHKTLAGHRNDCLPSKFQFFQLSFFSDFGLAQTLPACSHGSDGDYFVKKSSL